MTHYVYTPYVLPLIAAAAVSIFVVLYGWSRRTVNGARELVFLALSLFIWTVCYVFEISAARLDVKYVWGVIEYVGIVFAPYSWMLLSITYSGHQKFLTRRFYVLTLIIPLITLTLIFTNRWHGLVWSQYEMSAQENFFLPNISYGAWFWVHAAYSYFALLAGIFFLARLLRSQQGMYRGQVISLLVAVSAPFISNALYLADKSPIPYLDLTPFAFTVSVAALAWAIFGFHLADIAPLARDLVVEAMRDGMIVLDARGRVNDINSAAARIIGVPVANALGKNAEDLFSPWSHLWKKFRYTDEASGEISIGAGEAQRRYEINISLLQDKPGNEVGRVIMIHPLDAEDVPQPRFARSATAPSLTQPLPEMKVAPKSKTPFTLWTLIRNFYEVKIQKELSVPAGVNPAWHYTRERIFTLIARVVASIGTLAWIITQGISGLKNLNTAFIALISFFWILGAIRRVAYRYRILVFLTILYALAVVETYNFGFSVESFTLFLSFIVISAILTTRRGAMNALGITIFTLIPAAIALGAGRFAPALQPVNYYPQNIIVGMVSLAVFSASATAVTYSIVILTENLSSAWQQELQALNLLQQERDLLEKRVTERTADLEEARDSALRSNAELRKYFSAIEQSGSSIVITDADGKIEYVNPKFEEVSGYTLEEALGNNPRILKSGLQRQEFYKKLWDVIKAGQIWSGTFHNKRKNGSLYWESATIAPVIDQSGRVTHFVAVKEDITEQKVLRDQLQKQNDYLSVLHQITLDMLNRRTQEELLQIIVERASVLLDSPYCELLLEKDGELITEAFTRNIEGVKGERTTAEDGKLSWQAYASHQPVTLEDYSTWTERHIGLYNNAILRATAEIPIMARERCAGVLSLSRSTPDYPYSAEQVETGILFARLVALVLDNTALYQSAVSELEERKRVQLTLETQQREQDVLAKLLTLGIENLTLEEILPRALRKILSIHWLSLESKGGIFLADESGKTLTLAAQSGLAAEICNLCAIVPFGKCLCGLAAQTRQIQFSQHVEASHEISYASMPDHGHYNIPILSGEEVLGVIVLYLPLNYQQSKRDLVFLQSLANTLSNIIRRKRIEALLRDSEMRFRQIVENASDLIYRTDAQGNFVYINPTCLTVMGYDDEAQVLGKNYLDLAAPAFKRKLQRFYGMQFMRNEKNTYFEFEAINFAGESIWFGQSVQLIEEGGAITGFQAVARDITKLKQAQEALAISRDQALEASRAKGQLLSRVSHELRTPLSGILGFAELLQYKAYGELSEKQTQAVENIVASANYLASMVNDLLDEAQMNSQSLLLDNRYFTPQELLAQASLTLSVLAKKKGLDFQTTLSPELPASLYGDTKRLLQIILNLAGNAVKFTHSGSVIVRLCRREPTRWQIEVEDTGAGIPQSEWERVFEPFRQVSNAITRENRGSGLGLAIARQLAELMGGRISLQSEVGKGSVFTVSLPIVNVAEE